VRIKRSNPVVTKVKRNSGGYDVEIFEERGLVEQAISEYFSDVYKRPDHLITDAGNDNKDEKMINTASLLTVDGIFAAAKCSYFNKELGPDCFDGNKLRSSETLNERIIVEITEALKKLTFHNI
jgi:hypothetical protein